MPTTYKLCVFAENSDTRIGHFEAVDPQSAGGIPLPAFKVVTAQPPTGNLVGEAIINTTTGLSFVWDGLKWASVVPPSVIPHDTDTDVLADTTAAAGTAAFSKSSGNLWVRYDDGTGALSWRPVGARVYPTQVGLLADTPADGTIGYAVDTKAVFHRVGTAWTPGSWVNDTAANIQGATSVDGQLAFSTDTKKLFFADGAGGWDQLPWREYATEADLFADSPPTGTMAVALDTGHVAYWVVNKPPLASAWTIINSSVPSSTPIGTIEQSILTEAQFETALSIGDKGKWALCDGRDITGTDLATVTGNNTLPDLRGAFLRMAGTNASNSAWIGGSLGAWQEDTTARPDPPFTANNAGNHYHSLGTYDQERTDFMQQYHSNTAANPSALMVGKRKGEDATLAGSAEGLANEFEIASSTDGQHTHSINGGGDTETRPKNYSVNFFCKLRR